VRAGKSSREIRELEEERQKKIDEYNEKKKKIYEFENYLRGLENGFEIMWKKIRKRVLIKISN
jgi:predicted  nucleic acid-binding Zn-ribbon protein